MRLVMLYGFRGTGVESEFRRARFASAPCAVVARPGDRTTTGLVTNSSRFDQFLEESSKSWIRLSEMKSQFTPSAPFVD